MLRVRLEYGSSMPRVCEKTYYSSYFKGGGLKKVSLPSPCAQGAWQALPTLYLKHSFFLSKKLFGCVSYVYCNIGWAATLLEPAFCLKSVPFCRLPDILYYRQRTFADRCVSAAQHFCSASYVRYSVCACCRLPRCLGLYNLHSYVCCV